MSQKVRYSRQSNQHKMVRTSFLFKSDVLFDFRKYLLTFHLDPDHHSSKELDPHSPKKLELFF
jgi:hypothetical protein